MPRFHWLVVYRAFWRQLRLVYGRPERTVEHRGDAGTIRRGIAYGSGSQGRGIVPSHTFGKPIPGVGPGGALVKVTAKLHFRHEDRNEYLLWQKSFADAATQANLSSIVTYRRVPGLEQIQKQYPSEAPERQQQLLAEALAQFQIENTALYFMFIDSVLDART